MKNLVDIFSMPDEYNDHHGQYDRQYDHDPLDDDEGDLMEPFEDDWAGDLE